MQIKIKADEIQVGNDSYGGHPITLVDLDGDSKVVIIEANGKRIPINKTADVLVEREIKQIEGKEVR